MERDDDREWSRLLREWEAPDAPASLEGRVLARRDARWRMQFVAAMLAAALSAAAFWITRRPAPSGRELAAAEQPFVPVPNVLPLDSYEIGRVMRVDVPVSALIGAGYSLPLADPAGMVKADLLVGEDGRVHAVRLVSDTNTSGTGD
jgi:hypothetical protein